jgi:hypothetical protein
MRMKGAALTREAQHFELSFEPRLQFAQSRRRLDANPQDKRAASRWKRPEFLDVNLEGDQPASSPLHCGEDFRGSLVCDLTEELQSDVKRVVVDPADRQRRASQILQHGAETFSLGDRKVHCDEKPHERLGIGSGVERM